MLYDGWLVVSDSYLFIHMNVVLDSREPVVRREHKKRVSLGKFIEKRQKPNGHLDNIL